MIPVLVTETQDKDSKPETPIAEVTTDNAGVSEAQELSSNTETDPSKQNNADADKLNQSLKLLKNLNDVAPPDELSKDGQGSSVYKVSPDVSHEQKPSLSDFSSAKKSIN